MARKLMSPGPYPRPLGTSPPKRSGRDSTYNQMQSTHLVLRGLTRTGWTATADVLGLQAIARAAQIV